MPRRDLPAAAPGRRGLGHPYRAVLQPHGLRRLARPGVRGGADPRLRRGHRGRGVMPRCDAVLSGYVGDAEIGAAILDAARRVKAANPARAVVLRPGDRRCGAAASIVRPGIPEFFRDQALPAADIATPNHFELEWLTGRAARTPATRRRRSRRCRRAGRAACWSPPSAPRRRPTDAIDLLAAEDGAAWRLRTPLLPCQGERRGGCDQPRCSCSTALRRAARGRRWSARRPRSTGCCARTVAAGVEGDPDRRGAGGVRRAVPRASSRSRAEGCNPGLVLPLKGRF